VSERGPSTAQDVSVVVCTYSRDRLELLRGLARSVAAGTRRPAHLIVVVDRNPSLQAELHAEASARLAPWSLRTTVVSSDGGGLSAARNTGWLLASTDWVAFVDDDAIVGSTWLEELVAATRAHDADIVGGRIDPIWPAGEPRWYSERLGWVVGCSYRGLPTEAAVVRNVIGCNMLMRRAILERTGGFDEDLGRVAGGLAGCEETELCIRAAADGAKVVSIPGATVQQALGADRARIGYALRRGWDEGRSKAAIKRLHGGTPGVLGPETTYARDLVAEAAGRIATGLRRADRRELERGAAMLGVLAATTAGYLGHGIAARRSAGVTPVQAVPGEHAGRTDARSIAAHRST
jgi:GT2 family glycosyltransferase